MIEVSLSPFPPIADLRGEYRDHFIDEAIYQHAKQLYETRKCVMLPEGNAHSVKYHQRECLQLALCHAIAQREGLKAKEKKPHAAAQS